MENRFLQPQSFYRPMSEPYVQSRGSHARSYDETSQSFSSAKSVFSRAASTEQRSLVVLIENGGIDLDLSSLADKIIAIIPGGNMVPASMRSKLITLLHDEIKALTDDLMESAELALNHYSTAVPKLYGSVAVLRNSSASYTELKSKLISLSREGKVIDVLVLTHGSADFIAVNGDIDGAKIRQMRTEYGKPLSIRSVYMMNCVGSSLNKAWIEAGARTSCGALRNNYLPEPTTHFFWENWKAGQSFETAATSAYRQTINAMNAMVRGIVSDLLGPIGGLAAGKIDFASADFVQDSAPVVEGPQRNVTIASDSLSFTQSMSSGLATTVLSEKRLKSMSSGNGSAFAVTQTSSYYSPSTSMGRRGEFSRMQNPAIIAGIAVADAVQIGLAGVAIIQSQVNASTGTFQLAFDKAQRLLTNEARTKMPGSMKSKATYNRKIMHIGLILPGQTDTFANADIRVEWEGNPYGEIGTPVFSKDLHNSSDWSRSDASLIITKLDRIPVAGVDPRAWPILYEYHGSYDPPGNGKWEFVGEFELNAFGGLKFNKHDVVSRSLLDFAISGAPDEYVVKGSDFVAATPEIPPEQLEYLKANRPT
jgi:hypothetical protein